jgi:aminoglycoside 6-adenylyltransferase
MNAAFRENENRMTERFIAWGEGRDSLRAMILTSSRANPHAPLDAFSDYDLVLVVNDIRPYHNNQSWLADFGEVLVMYQDPIHIDYGFENFALITQYADGLKIDFHVVPVEFIRRIAGEPDLPDELDIGYRVLLDKDQLTTGLKPPSYRAHIPDPPSETAYREVIEEFFHEATYAVKYFWRGELMPAKYFLDYAMKQDNLRRMLEWLIEIDYGWSVKPGVLGRSLQSRLRPELWSELEKSYVGPGWEENWEALYQTIDVFRKAAEEVGSQLGYAYPDELDRRAVAYFQKVQGLGSDISTFP